LLLAEFLAGEGFQVTAVADGEAGVRAALDGSPDLVVLDVMLPRLNGFEALRRIRERSPVPVLMLTARGEEVDRIVGLELGADDYLPKPFNPRELAARMRAVLRRTATGPDDRGDEALAVADVRLDRTGSRPLRRASRPSASVRLLAVLLRSAGRVVSRTSCRGRSGHAAR
jgi:DNA-binding response OmpR family regulator